MDINAAIKRMIETGKVEFGSNKALKSLKEGKAKLIIMASNCPKHTKEDILHYSKLSEIPVLEYENSSLDLGKVCGKPFLISNLVVLNPGSVAVKELIREKKGKSKK